VQLATYLGFAIFFIALACVVYAVGLKLLGDRMVPGWALVIVAILLSSAVSTTCSGEVAPKATWPG
jgi:hypothetical protein